MKETYEMKGAGRSIQGMAEDLGISRNTVPGTSSPRKPCGPRRGPYLGPADLMRRAEAAGVVSLIMAGALDSIVSNSRNALWDAGLGILPGRNGQRSFSGAVNWNVAGLPDFTAFERMADEYRVMGIYFRGHLMEFVRPSLGPRVLPGATADYASEGEDILNQTACLKSRHARWRVHYSETLGEESSRCRFET